MKTINGHDKIKNFIVVYLQFNDLFQQKTKIKFESNN
jgi:hypothetical protein